MEAIGRAAFVLGPPGEVCSRSVSRGLTNATIAATLGVSERAIELHVSTIFDRAGVPSRAALVAKLLEG